MEASYQDTRRTKPVLSVYTGASYRKLRNAIPRRAV
jgi:hypothetical protein